MADLPIFEAFPKMPRLNRDCVITEKIDGTNACVYVDEDFGVHAASRTRWITPDDDNYGFAQWVAEHKEELYGLGTGMHFGEWWGAGIQRRYDQPVKRFSLFNTARWGDDDVRPACCDVVPVLQEGLFTMQLVAQALHELRYDGSVAAPGFMHPEGVVIYHTASRGMFKVTLEGDEKPKGSNE